MANQTTKSGKSYPLGKVLLFLAFLDAIWATALATLNATVLHEAGTAAGASDGGTTLATVLTWFITWVIAFIQGGVFIFVFGVFAILLVAFFSKARSNQSPADGSDKSSSEE